MKGFGLQAGYGHVVLSSGDIDIFVVGEVTAARVTLQLHVINLELGDGSLLRFVNSVFWFLENNVVVIIVVSSNNLTQSSYTCGSSQLKETLVSSTNWAWKPSTGGGRSKMPSSRHVMMLPMKLMHEP